MAHPRSRGENAGTSMEDMGAIGSSPLTRGKPLPAQGMTLEFRLIPAHAGKTGEIGCKTVIARAHPRSRGENLIPLTNPSISDGSSPLTRGKQPAFLKDLTEIRLIPAHAGKTRCLHPWTRTGTAHPRSRGENPLAAWLEGACEGSSPLTRGKPALGEALKQSGRLIPAHAGKTLTLPSDTI